MQHSSTTSPWWICISLFALVGFFTGCALPKPDYATLPNGSQWLLVAFGDRVERLDSAALVYYTVSVADENYQEFFYYSDVTAPAHGDELWSLLSNLFVGDSLHFLSVTRDFIRPDTYTMDTLYYAISIDRMKTHAQVDNDQYRELMALQELISQDTILKKYREYKDVWMRTLQPGDSNQVCEGCEVVIHYQGRGLTGNVFDDTRERNMPLRFVYGHEHQVLRGIEYALERMHRGEKAEVIIPSWLAFGSKGSAYNLVPPFTPVIYEIEVMELARK